METQALPPHHSHNMLYAPEGTTKAQFDLLSEGLAITNRLTEVLTRYAGKFVDVVALYQSKVYELNRTGPISRKILWKNLGEWVNMCQKVEPKTLIPIFEREIKTLDV